MKLPVMLTIPSQVLIHNTQFFLSNNRIFPHPFYCTRSSLGLLVAWKVGKSQNRNECWRREMKSCDKYVGGRAGIRKKAQQTRVETETLLIAFCGILRGQGGSAFMKGIACSLPASLFAAPNWLDAIKKLKF